MPRRRTPPRPRLQPNAIDAGVQFGVVAMQLAEAGVTPREVAAVAKRAQGRHLPRVASAMRTVSQTMAWAEAFLPRDLIEEAHHG